MKNKIIPTPKLLLHRAYILFLLIVSVTFNSYAATFTGSGTEDDPFLITDADELYEVRSYLNRSYYFRLENDIDLTEFIEDNFPENGWSPIGSSKPFCGTFDGNGKTISGMIINSTGDNIGLFGQFRGVLKNLTVKGSVKGNNNVGGIVGLAELYSTNEFTTISDCVFEGTVTGHSNIGGIVGKMSDGNHTRYMGIYRCGVKGTVTSTNYNTGGVVGYCDAYVAEHCWMSGNVYGSFYTGGICGYGKGRFVECYAKCDIGKGTQYSTLYAGGIVGWLEGTYYNGGYSCILRCQYVGNIDGNGMLGGIVQRADATIISGNIARGTIVSKGGTSGMVGGVITDMHRAVVNNSYRYNSISGNVVACTSICLETTSSLTSYMPARVISLSTIDSNNTIGSEGSAAENIALSTMDITLNGETVSTTDYAHHGTGVTMAFMKKKLCYTAKNWDFDTVWAIDDNLNDGFPYIQAMESVIRDIESDNGGNTPDDIRVLSVTEVPAMVNGIYGIDGRKITKPINKGIYIIDGKKVVVK